jgi:hypothetical protein
VATGTLKRRVIFTAWADIVENEPFDRLAAAEALSDDGGLVFEGDASREELGERALSHEIKTALRQAGHYYVGAFSPAQVGPVEPWR